VRFISTAPFIDAAVDDKELGLIFNRDGQKLSGMLP